MRPENDVTSLFIRIDIMFNPDNSIILSVVSSLVPYSSFWRWILNSTRSTPCADPEGGQGSDPLKNHIIWFLSNTGPDPLKHHKATKTAFNVGPSSAHQRKNGVSQAGR